MANPWQSLTRGGFSLPTFDQGSPHQTTCPSLRLCSPKSFHLQPRVHHLDSLPSSIFTLPSLVLQHRETFHYSLVHQTSGTYVQGIIRWPPVLFCRPISPPRRGTSSSVTIQLPWIRTLGDEPPSLAGYSTNLVCPSLQLSDFWDLDTNQHVNNSSTFPPSLQTYPFPPPASLAFHLPQVRP